MKCEYCSMPGVLRIPKGEESASDVFVCNPCWKLLQNPLTAIPLLRGHLNLTLRDRYPPEQVKSIVDTFISEISRWKPRTIKS